MVSAFRLPLTLLNVSFRLQFPFVFRQPQSLQLLLLAHPCLPVSLPTFSGLPLSRPVAASASLSDPRCFRSLSVASVLGSDYSASVSSFPFSSCLRLTVASSVLRFCFRFLGFPRSSLPGFPCILSRFWYSAFLFVSFRPSSLRSHSCSTSACLPLSLPAFSGSLPLSFVRFYSGSDYSAFCSSFPFFPVSPLSGFPGARFHFRFFAFPFLSSLISHADRKSVV